MSLLDDIRNDVKKAGTNKGKIMYFREGNKTRIRFLEDMENGRKFTFHDSFSAGINVPCQEIFGRDCKYCEMEGLRTRDLYCWCVYDYDSNEVKILLSAVNNCSPIPALMAMYETYGTLTDRDYVISVSGKQQNKTFSVVPMDKNKFRNQKAKPLSESKILSIIDKAYPADDSEQEEEDYKSAKRKQNDTADNDEWEEDENQYSNMTAKELYMLCKERGLECVPKKQQAYYINLLEEDDKANDDWADEEDEEEDDWE